MTTRKNLTATSLRRHHYEDRRELEQDNYPSTCVTMRLGIDFDETFAPVVRFETLRLVLLIAGLMRWKVKQYDFVTAFLNAKLGIAIYVEQPVGYKVKGKEDYVCLLQKSLYGLKQAPLEWNNALDELLHEIGFRRCYKDYGLYILREGDVTILLTVYVDDVLIIGTETDIKRVETKLNERFKMKALGTVRYLLGIEIAYEASYVGFSQRKYAEDVLKKFRMEAANSARIPVQPGADMEDERHRSTNNNAADDLAAPAQQKIGCGAQGECTALEFAKHTGEMATSAHDQRVQNLPYRSAVGHLQYLVSGSRPDLSTAVRMLSEHLHDFTREHWRVAQRVMTYLAGTQSDGLRFDLEEARKYENLQLELFVDADYANNRRDRRSITGFVLFCCGQMISSKSWKQALITESTCEAELVAANDGLHELIWIEQMIDELQFKRTNSVVYCDNEAAICILKHPTRHRRTKHIAIKYLKNREVLKQRWIQLKRVASVDNVADMHTKPLPQPAFAKFKSLLGIQQIKTS
ncbi:hypothetical protein Gpo141_00013862 [Globisporangium polare]